MRARKQYPESLIFIPNHFKTYEMYAEAVEEDPKLLEFVPDKRNSQEMYNKVVLKDSCLLEKDSDYYKTHKTCDKAMEQAIHTTICP